MFELVEIPVTSLANVRIGQAEDTAAAYRLR